MGAIKEISTLPFWKGGYFYGLAFVAGIRSTG